VVWKHRRASRDIEHLGSAHTDAHPGRQFVLPGRGHIAVVTDEDPQPDDLRQAPSPDPHPGCALVWPKSGPSPHSGDGLRLETLTPNPCPNRFTAFVQKKWPPNSSMDSKTPMKARMSQTRIRASRVENRAPGVVPLLHPSPARIRYG
jgi:hypothetical protein